MLLVGLALILSTLSGCASNQKCSVDIGTSSLCFREADIPGNWRIDSITCDGTASEKVLDPEDYFPGACSQLGDTDYDLYYKFMLGTLCYNDYAEDLSVKAKWSMVVDYDHFTR